MDTAFGLGGEGMKGGEGRESGSGWIEGINGGEGGGWRGVKGRVGGE